MFDKVTVLYEGRQIYFGACGEAKAFFTKLGFGCAPRQTDADFLTSLTNPAERIIRPGFEKRTPRTSEEFAAVWERSLEYAKLVQDIELYEKRYPLNGPAVAEFAALHRAQQAGQQ